MGDDLDTIKQVIRSLLVTSKCEVTLKEFLKDYRENEGCDLPYQQFGSSSVKEFLEKLCDTVRVTTPSPGTVLLSPAVTADIQHIDKLVRTQKATSSKRGGHAKFPVRRTRRVAGTLSVPKRPTSIVQAFQAKKQQASAAGSRHARPTSRAAAAPKVTAAESCSGLREQTARGDASNGSTSSTEEFEKLTREEGVTKEGLDYHAHIVNEFDPMPVRDNGGKGYHTAGKQQNAVTAPARGMPEMLMSSSSTDNVTACSNSSAVSRASLSGAQQSALQGNQSGLLRQVPHSGWSENINYERSYDLQAEQRYDVKTELPPLQLETESVQPKAAERSEWSAKLFASSATAPRSTGASGLLETPKQHDWTASCGYPPFPQPAVINRGLMYQATASSWQVSAGPSAVYLPGPPVGRMPFFLNPALQYSQQLQGMPHVGANIGYPVPVTSFVMQQSLGVAPSNGAPLNVCAPPYVPSGTLTVSSTGSANCGAETVMSQLPSNVQPRVESEDKRMPPEVVSGVTAVLKSHSDGVHIKLLPKLYEDEVGKHAFFDKNCDPVRLVKEIIEWVPMVTVSSLVGGDFLVKLLEPDDEEVDDDATVPEPPEIPAEVASNIEVLLRRHPEGIAAHDLLRLYKAELGEHWYFTDETSSVIKLTHAIKSNVPSVTVKSLVGGRFLLKSAEADRYGNREEKRIGPAFAEGSTSEEELSSYCKQTLPVTHAFPVAIGEVFSPDEFYILIRGEGTTGALQKLMKDLNAFYTAECSLSYAVKREDVRPGFPCAAPYTINGKPHWHRAQVLSRKISKVCISYIDYGTTMQVDRDKLRRLCPRFMELPVQGIKVSLAGIRPRGTRNWPQEAKEHFLKLMKENTLQCKVEERQGDSIKVNLWRNVSCRLRSIADILVEEGYAEETRPKQPTVPLEWSIVPCYLKKGGQLDVITWKGVRYVTGWNVSELFGWHTTRVEELLAEKQIVFNIIIVMRSEQPALFMDIVREQGRGGQEEIVTLFKLSSLIDLLNLFGHPSRIIRKEVKDILHGERRSRTSDGEEGSTDEEDREKMQAKLENKLEMLQDEQRSLRMKAYGGDLSVTEEQLKFIDEKVQSTREILKLVKLQRQMCLCRKKETDADALCDAVGGTARDADCGTAPVRELQTKLMQMLSAKKC